MNEKKDDKEPQIKPNEEKPKPQPTAPLKKKVKDRQTKRHMKK